MANDRNSQALRVLSAWGADAKRWPEELRDRVAGALEGDPELRRARDREALLDDWLGEDPLQPAPAVSEILAALPRPLLDRFLGWLWPSDGVGFWRPALAACLPLALGLALGMALPGNGSAQSWEVAEQGLLIPYGGLDP